MKPRPFPQIDPGKIAIVKLSAIGDVIHALPVAAALRQRYPQAHLTWIVERKSRDILDGCPDLDEVLIFDKARWIHELPYPHRTIPVLWQIRQFIRKMRQAHFDLVIDLQGLLKSGLLTWLTGSSIRLGFAPDFCRESGSALFTNYRVSPSEQGLHIIDQYLSVVKDLGIDTSTKTFHLSIPEEDKTYIENFLKKKNLNPSAPLFIINPGAGWVTKQWGEERYAQLADRIVTEIEGTVLFLWGPSELSMVKSIQKKMHSPSLRSCPTTLKQSMALIKRAHFFIAGDTGPLHLAAALNIPCIGIYGPSSSQRNGPYGTIHKVVQSEVSCRGCFRRLCDHWECMKSIPVDRVMESIGELLP